MDAAASGYLAPFVEPAQAIDVQHPDDPAAGANFSFVYPGNRIVVPLSVSFQVVTAVAVANRTVRVEYDDGRGEPFYREICGSVQAASTTALYSASMNRGAADVDTNNFISMPLLAIPLLGGHALQVNVTNIQAADQISALVICYGRLALPG